MIVVVAAIIEEHEATNEELLAANEYVAGGQYTIADMAIWPWYGGLVQGALYGAAEFLSVQDYKNVQRWAASVGARPAVKRGRKAVL